MSLVEKPKIDFPTIIVLLTLSKCLPHPGMLFRSEHNGSFRGRPPWCSPWGLNWSLSRGLRTQESSAEEAAVKKEGLSRNTVRPPRAVKGLCWTSDRFQWSREAICWLTQRFICAFGSHVASDASWDCIWFQEDGTAEHSQQVRRAGAAGGGEYENTLS